MATVQQRINFSARKTRSQSCKELESATRRNPGTPATIKYQCADVDLMCTPSKVLRSRTIQTAISGNTKASPTKTWPAKEKRKKRKQTQCDENTPEDNAVKSNISPKKNYRENANHLTPKQLFKQDVSVYQELKTAFSLTSVNTLPCRETETKTITEFLENHLLNDQPGSLYISGAPGTGKTICLNQILLAPKYKCKTVMVNCTTLKTANSIYEHIWQELKGVKGLTESGLNMKKELKKLVTNSNKMMLLILDEIDYLESRDQEALYTIFEWPSLENSRLILIGVANALDLTDRVLPRLQCHSDCRPLLLHFPPYSKDDILTILQSRLQQVPISSQQVMKDAALQFCARKVSSVSGDIRKALDVSRRAVEIVETGVRNQSILQPRSFNNDANSKKDLPCVELGHIVTILNKIYGSTVQNHCADGDSLPLHQKLLLCTTILASKWGKSKEITIGKCHEIYSRICKKRNMPPLDQSDFTSMCGSVESRGLIAIQGNKDSRLSKISLRVDENDAELVMQDRALLVSILQDNSCL